jgi:hypothetical protein
MSSAESGLPVEVNPPQDPGRNRFRKLLIRAVMVPSVIALCLFVVSKAGQLWDEWKELQDELFVTEQHSVIGFLNIAPIASFAEGPKDWYRVEGDQSYLWFGWERNTGHRWFRFASGEIDPSRLRHPESQFISQAIDFPVAEKKGGRIFGRMPSETPVVGTKIENHDCVYPVAVLGKVIVINDIVNQHPYMVVLNPFAKQAVAFSVYDSLLEGRRITLAPTGYFQDGRPVLFDRGTESLWIEMHDGLTAMAGKLYRKRLMRVAIPSPVTWGTWISRNPDSRLLVGADRSLGIPTE